MKLLILASICILPIFGIQTQQERDAVSCFTCKAGITAVLGQLSDLDEVI